MSSDPIAIVKVLSSSQRSVTPSKLLVRNATPQRATSNPRASSATKTRFAIAKEAQMSSEVSHRAPSRSASRRKQRRWENMHLFSSEVNDVLMRELDDEYSSMSIRKSRFEVDVRSAFKKLFEPGNAAALEAFRLCAEKVDHQRPKHSKQSSVEQAWMNVEKKLRTILVQSILKNPDVLSFLAELENLVIHFKHLDEGVFLSTIDSLLKESSAIDSSLLQPPTVNEEGQLEIYFKDSAFHRLLLHCVSQFHRLTSKSFVAETGAKVTLITKQKITQAEEKESLRLVNFLHDRALLGLRDKD